MLNKIFQGNALDKLKELEAESVDCCITSPPYWALRDYKTPGQLGLEPTFTEYISKLVEIFAEVKRILKKTGSLWVNLGDTYNFDKRSANRNLDLMTGFKRRDKTSALRATIKTTPTKSLCLIPQRFQIAMVDQGWICRNTIIWYKPNCMPSSAKDRFTVDFEYLFFFTKSQRYYFETQYEPMIDAADNARTIARYRSGGIESPKAGDPDVKSKIPFAHYYKDGKWPAFGGKKAAGYENPTYSGEQREISPLGRIKRCVWKIPTQPFSEAHFAVFPPAIVETPLKATCPEYVCKKCGRPREKIVEKEYQSLGDDTNWPKSQTLDPTWTRYGKRRLGKAIITGEKTLGYNICDCNAGFNGGIVLDPFMGSGTVALVAMQNARNFIGIELSQAYIDMAMDRLDPYLKQERLQFV